MKVLKSNYFYDFNEDIYYVKVLDRNYKCSFDNKNFIFDLNENNEICGIEILNASKVFGITKIDLKDIISNKVEIVVYGDLIKFKINFLFKIRNLRKEYSYVYDMINFENLPSMKEGVCFG